MAKEKTNKKSPGKKKGKKSIIEKKVVKSSFGGEGFESQNKILRNVIIISLIIILAIVASVLWENRSKEFEYNGVEFRVIEFCDGGPSSCLVTYNTKLPVVQDGRDAEYNFYLRNDPRKLEKKVDFDGELILRSELFLNITYERSCEGYSSIAVENIARLIGVSGIKLLTANDSETPGIEGMDLTIQEGNETRVVQTGSASYVIDIKECEILQGTERFMNEMLIEINEKIR